MEDQMIRKAMMSRFIVTILAVGLVACNQSNQDTPLAHQIIDAVHDNGTGPSTATEERELLIQVVRESGPADESWASQATEILESWNRAISDNGAYAASEVECYTAGCFINMEYESEEAHILSGQALVPDPAENFWQGITIVTGPEYHTNGEVANSWVLLPASQDVTEPLAHTDVNTAYRFSATTCRDWITGDSPQRDSWNYSWDGLRNLRTTSAVSEENFAVICPIGGWRDSTVDIEQLEVRFNDRSPIRTVSGFFAIQTWVGSIYFTPALFSCGGSSGCTAPSEDSFVGIGILTWTNPFPAISNVRNMNFWLSLPKPASGVSSIIGYHIVINEE